jgi:hypothetical protein
MQAQGSAVPRNITAVQTTKSASWATGGYRWNDPSSNYAPTEADVFLHLTMPTVNTTTVYVQASADNSNWANLTTLTSNAVTDTNVVSTVSTSGQFFRISATSGNTETYTVAVKVMLKRDDVQ